MLYQRSNYQKNGRKLTAIPNNLASLPHLPRLETNESAVDISLLDVMGIEEYLTLLKTKTDNNSKELWKASCTLAVQLKASRELLSIGSNLFSNKSNRKILDRLVESTYVILGAERVYLLEIDSTGRDLVVTHSKEEYSIGHRFAANRGIEGDVISRKVCANVLDTANDPRFQPLLDLRSGQRTCCLVCSPIIYDGEVIGVIEAINKASTSSLKYRDASDVFTSNDAILLNFIATTVSLALKQTPLFRPGGPSIESILNQSVNVETGLRSILNDSSSSTTSGFNKRTNWIEFDLHFQSLLETAYNKLEAERVSMFTYSSNNRSLSTSSSSSNLKALSSSVNELNKTGKGSSFRSMQIVNVYDCKEDDRWSKEFDHKTRNVLSAPILDTLNGTTLGVVQAINKKNASNFNIVDEETIKELSEKMATLLKEKSNLDNKNSSGIKSLDGVTLARLVANMMLSNSIEELSVETEGTIKSLTGCNFTGIYIVDHDNLLKLYPTTNNPKLYRSKSNEQLNAENGSNKLFVKAATKKSGCIFDRMEFVDTPPHIKHALQYNFTLDFKKGSSVSKTDLEMFTFFDLKVQNAMIIPINKKLFGYQPGTVLMVVANTINDLPINAQNREIIELIATEFFTGALSKVSDKLAYEESIKTLKINFHLLNTTLSTLQDFIILLNCHGNLVACNKLLEDLLGGQRAKDGCILDGMHYTQWFSSNNSEELFNDINDAFITGKILSQESTKLITPIYPKGLFIDYEVIPIQNPDFSSNPTNSIFNNDNSSNTFNNKNVMLHSFSTTTTTTRTDTLSSNLVESLEQSAPFAIVIIIHISKQRSSNTSNNNNNNNNKQDQRNSPSSNNTEVDEVKSVSSDANSAAKILPTDPHSVQVMVDNSISILKAVRNSFALDDETEQTLKKITASLTDTSRKMSLASITQSPVEIASQKIDCPLVNKDIPTPENIYEWEYNVLQITDKLVLCNIIGKLFESMIDFNEIAVDKNCLARYILEVSKNYHDRPFHNFQHSACVTHFSYMLLKGTKANENLKIHQRFAVMVGGLVHDIDHPGNTNLFEINSGSELALRYNDQSVLEAHHCSTAFRLMRKPNIQILSTLPRPMINEIRRLIIACVMGTDMAGHFDLIDETKKRVPDGLNLAEAKDQALLGKMITHAADLSNPVRPFDMTRAWAEKISVEFANQVANEQSLGLPVLGFMVAADEKAFCKNETGFASFVVAPMWRSIIQVFPALTFLVEQLDSNLQTWKSLIDKITAEEKAALEEKNSNEEPKK